MKTIQVYRGIFPFLFSTLLGFNSVGLAAILKSCDETSLRAALAGGGTVTFSCDGTIMLTNTIVIGANTTLDANGHRVTISGGNAVRIFDVLSNVSLSLNNLTLAYGRVTGVEGAVVGQGGAVRVQGGTLCAVGCTFATNNAVGKKGGTMGEGGAVYAASAVLRLTNCVFNRNAATGGGGADAPPDNPLVFGGDGGGSRGGSISAFSSQILLAGGVLTNNAANPGTPGAGRWTGNFVNTWGGALYAEDCACDGTGLTWRGNQARAAGGACFFQTGMTAFASCVFDGNTVGAAPQAHGGAIRSQNARLSLVDCLLRNNTAQGSQAFQNPGFGQNGGLAEGGAVIAAGGRLGVTNCAFVGNLAQGGGGVFVGTPFFVLPAGSAQGGGLSHSGTGAVVNCTFAGNSAIHGWKVSPQSSGGLGGALASFGGSLTVRFCTIGSNFVSDTGNSSSVTNFVTTIFSQGAGCYVGGGSLLLASSILSGNVASLGGGSGSVPANAAGLVTDGGCNLSSDGTPAFAAESSLNNTDPLLGPLADNGGPTPTMALLPTSPAINAGNSEICPPTDQRGVSRPQLGDCDIGAFELADGFYILAIQRTGPQSYRLSGLGIPNRNFRVEASERFSHWVDAATGAADSHGLFGLEVDAGGQQQRFYRIASP